MSDLDKTTTEPTWTPQREAEWTRDSQHWRGKVLTGRYRHWCMNWDCLPVDETCPEWPCGCFDGT